MGSKQTEAGVIPEDWVVKQVGAVATIFGRIGFRGYTVNDIVKEGKGAIALSPSNINDGKLRLEKCTYVSWAKYHESPEIKIEKGDIILVKTGSTTGKVAYIDDIVHEATLNPQMIVFKRLRIDARYLGFLATTPVFQDQIRNTIVGGALPTLSQKQVANYKIPVPPTEEEQRAIAEALSDVDALISGLDRLIAKKRGFKQAAMQELLTGKRRLPGFKGKWEVKRISEIALPSSDKNSTGEVLPVLTCSKHLGFVDSLGFFKNQVFSKDLSTYKVIKSGQIGYPSNHVEEGSIGLQDIYDTALVSPIYIVFSVNEEINSFFLHRLLKLDSYRQKFKTATTSSVDRRGSLRWPAFSGITVSIPALAEQTAIAAVLSDMDAEIAMLERRREKTKALKQGMMQELLTGKIRLV